MAAKRTPPLPEIVLSEVIARAFERTARFSQVLAKLCGEVWVLAFDGGALDAARYRRFDVLYLRLFRAPRVLHRLGFPRERVCRGVALPAGNFDGVSAVLCRVCRRHHDAAAFTAEAKADVAAGGIGWAPVPVRRSFPSEIRAVWFAVMENPWNPATAVCACRVQSCSTQAHEDYSPRVRLTSSYEHPAPGSPAYVD